MSAALHMEKLCDIAELNPKFKEKLENDSNVSFVPMAAVLAETSTVIGEEKQYCEVSKGYTPFADGDVLVAKITPCFENGKITQAKLKNKVGFGSTEFHVVRPLEEKLDARYLLHFLRQERIRLEGERKMTGSAGQRRVPANFLASLEIPLPLLEEQKKIADILDRAEALRAKRRAALAQLDELVQSIFIEMFGGLETNPKGWTAKSFDHFAKIDTKMIKDFSGYENKPHIGIENIEKDTGNLINYEEVGAQNLTSGKYLFTKDHIIYSKIRPNLNKVALPDFDGLCSADAYPLLVNKNYTNRYFFAYILRSKYFLNNILKLSDRTNIPKVNKDQLRSFECICPPIELQNQFAHRVEAIKKLKEMHKSSLAELDALFASLQYRAFRGGL